MPCTCAAAEVDAETPGTEETPAGLPYPTLPFHDGSACSDVQVLIVFAALSTCDPGNVLDAVKAAKQHRVRASVVGIAAEVHICRVLTQARPC